MGGGGEAETQTLVEAALEVLNTPDPFEKARLGEAAAARWLLGDISVPYRDDGPPPLVPDRPARLSSVIGTETLLDFRVKKGEKKGKLTVLCALAGETGVAEHDAEAGQSREFTEPAGHPT